jgi:hypothetical protein
MFDYFVAGLHCRSCGTMSPATAATGMQTHIRSDADGSELRVSFVFDAIDLETEHILRSGYALIAAPPNAHTMRLLDVWTCPKCLTEEWGAVDIVDGRIERIEAVSMGLATLQTANFIADVSADILAASLLGISTNELSQRKIHNVDVLRERLR